MNKKILNTIFCPYHRIGYLGNYGTHTDKNINRRLAEAQRLVDNHNEIINSFETEEENIDFHNLTVSTIDKLLKNIYMKNTQLRPCDCRDSVDTSKLEEQGIGHNDESILVVPNYVLLTMGHTTVKIPMSRFKK